MWEIGGRSQVGIVVRFDLGNSGVRDSGSMGSNGSESFSGVRDSGSMGSRVGESGIAGKALQIGWKMLQIDSVHEFPTLCDSAIDIQNIQDDMSHHRLCKSHEVAMDNRQSNSSGMDDRQSNSNGSGNALGNKSKSSSNGNGSALSGDSTSKIKSTCMNESRSDVLESSVAGHIVESRVASVGKSKAVGGKSKAVGGKSISNDDDNNDNDDRRRRNMHAMSVWRSCVAGNPPPLSKVGGRGLVAPTDGDGTLQQGDPAIGGLSQIKDRVSSEPGENQEVRKVNACTPDGSPMYR